MTAPADDRNPPMAEPGQRAGASTGGISSNADGGLADALQRASERADDDATGAATTGEGVSAGAEPRLDLGGKNEPGSPDGARVPVGPVGPAGASATPRARERPIEPRNRSADEDQTPPHRQGGTEPPDEGVLESLGRAISEPLAGAEDADVPRDSAGRKR